MEEVLIRPAQVAELAELEALQRRASLANPGDREAVLAHPDAIEIPVAQLENGWGFVAERDGRVAGFAIVVPREDGDVDLDGLFVEPTLWRSGTGRALVRQCARFAHDSGAGSLRVEANPHAEDFYLRCGFEETGRGTTRFGPSLLMGMAV